MPPFLDDDQLTDRERLVEFVRFLHEFLSMLVRSEFIDRELAPFVRAAWKDLEKSKEFARFERAVGEVDDGAIAAHGLYGSQLELKRRVIGRWWSRFTSSIIPSKEVLLYLIDAIDTLLRSLVDAVGLGKAIEELKDAVRDSIPD